MITIERYIAENNTPAAQTLLQKYGMGQGKTWDELHAKLRNVLTNYKDQAAKDLALIDTPYKRLIEANMTPVVVNTPAPTPIPVVTPEVKHSCDGNGNGCKCGGKCAGSMHRESLPSLAYRADGSQTTQASSDFKYMPHLTIAALAFALGYIIAKPK